MAQCIKALLPSLTPQVWSRACITSQRAEEGEGLRFQASVPKLWENKYKQAGLNHLGCDNLLCHPRKLTYSPTEPQRRLLVAIPNSHSDLGSELPWTWTTFETLHGPSPWKSWWSLKMQTPVMKERTEFLWPLHMCCVPVSLKINKQIMQYRIKKKNTNPSL